MPVDSASAAIVYMERPRSLRSTTRDLVLADDLDFTGRHTRRSDKTGGVLLHYAPFGGMPERSVKEAVHEANGARREAGAGCVAFP